MRSDAADSPSALQKSVAKPKTGATRITTTAYLDSALTIVRSYPLEVDEQDVDAPETPSEFSGFEPKIILSESFAAPE